MSPTNNAELATGTALAVSAAAMFAIAAAPALVALVAGEGGLLAVLLVSSSVPLAIVGALRRSERLLLGATPLLVLGAMLATPRIALEAITSPVGTLSASVSVVAFVVSAALYTHRTPRTTLVMRPADGRPQESVGFGTPVHRLLVALVVLAPLVVFALRERGAFFTAKSDAITTFVVATAVFVAAIATWIVGIGPAIGAPWDAVAFELEARRLNAPAAARRERVALALALVTMAGALAALWHLLGTG